MKEYVCLWHIGKHTRGEIVKLDDETAKRLLKRGAIAPIGKAAKEPEQEPVKEPEQEPEQEPEADEEPEAPEIEDGAGDEAEEETEADEEPEAPEIDALEAIGEAEPEPEKPARKPRKSNKKEG